MAPAGRHARSAVAKDLDRDGGLKSVPGPQSRFDELYGANAVRIGRLCRVQDLRKRRRQEPELIALWHSRADRAVGELDFANLHDG